MFIDDKMQNEIKQHLSGLKNDVRLIYFTQSFECQYCRETRELLSELEALSDNIKLEVKDFESDKELAEKYNVDKIPAIVLLDENGVDYGIKFYGIPSGYEFASLLEDIVMLGTGTTNIPETVAEKIKNIDAPIHLQVFVTPTCPYCPSAVLTAHQMAYLNSNIKADMIEATEFPHLSTKYNVRGVPRTVINENEFLEGAVPEKQVLDKINKALQTV